MGLTFEIDRGTETLIATAESFFSKKQKRYSLQDNPSVQLIERISVVEEGYGAIFYSLVLERQGEHVELMSTLDEQEAASYRKTLFTLLNQYRTQH